MVLGCFGTYRWQTYFWDESLGAFRHCSGTVFVSWSCCLTVLSVRFLFSFFMFFFVCRDGVRFPDEFDVLVHPV